MRKTPLQDGDGLGGQACVPADLAPLAGQTLAGPGGDLLDNPHHTNLDEIMQWEASLPG
jgi:hypothetical protein